MLNTLNVMGRLVSTPELKTAGNQSFTNFSIAVERNFTNKDGNRECDFIPVVAWRNTADFICRHFLKGKLILLQGSMQSRSYTTKDGHKRSVLELVVDAPYFAGDNSKPKTESSQADDGTEGDMPFPFDFEPPGQE